MVSFRSALGMAVVLAGGTLIAGCRHTMEHAAHPRSIKDDLAPVSSPYASSVPQPSRKRVAAAKPRAERTPVAKIARAPDREPSSKSAAATPPMVPAPSPAPVPAARPQPQLPAISAPVVAPPSSPGPAPSASTPPPAPTPATTPAPAPKAAAPSPSTAAPAPNGLKPPEAPDPIATERHLEDGKRLFAEGKVIEARKRYVEALNGPIPDALLALARSFDTHYLSRLPRSDAAPDMQRALTLYTRASERGAADAAADLERVRNMLKQKQ